MGLWSGERGEVGGRWRVRREGEDPLTLFG